MGRLYEDDEERDERAPQAPRPPVIAPAAQRALAMQRAVGNQAAAAVLARDHGVPTSLGMRGPTASGLPAALDPANVAQHMLGEQLHQRPALEHAVEEVFTRHGLVPGAGGQTALSMAELVDLVRHQGGDLGAFSTNDIARELTERFRRGGVRIRAHRDAGDEEGQAREAEATIKNELSGGSLSDVHLSMANGLVRIDLSGVTVGRGDTRATVTGGPGGVEVSAEHGGTSAEASAGPDGFSLALEHANDHVRFAGHVEVKPGQGDARAEWNASITIGTPHAPDPAALARILRGIEESMREAAEQAAEHGRALTRQQIQDQLTAAKEALDALREEAERQREARGPQFSVSLQAGSDPRGGVQGMLLFTLQF